MKIFIVGGSSRSEESRSNVVVDVIASLFPEQTSVWKLADKPLPLAKHEWHKNPSLSDNENVLSFAKELQESNVVVLVSPIYNGSYTAHIKNALDCMDGSALFGKNVVLISFGSDSTAILPVLHLQDVARTMGGFVYPRFTVVSSSQIDFDARSLSSDIVNRIEEIIESSTKFNKKEE
jgi:NAD(P)H-dependent FMN reductase